MEKLAKTVHENLRAFMVRLPTYNENHIEFSYRNYKYSILFIKKLFEYIEPLVDLNENKLDFSIYSYHNYSLIDLKMHKLCDNEIYEDLLKTNSLCEWLSTILETYFTIMQTYNDRILNESYKFFKGKI